MITTTDPMSFLSFGQFISKLLERHGLKKRHVAELSKPISPRRTLKVTTDILTDKKIPKTIINCIKSLIDNGYATEPKFIDALKPLLSEEQYKRYGTRLIEAAKYGTKGIDEGTMSRICTDSVPQQRITRMDAALHAGDKLATYLQQAGIPKSDLGNLQVFRLWYALVQHPYKYMGIVPQEDLVDPDTSKILAALSRYPKGSKQRAAIAETIVSLCESLDPILQATHDATRENSS